MNTDLVQIGGFEAAVPTPENGKTFYAAVPTPENGKTFYIETFGCQMNVHDSEKVAGVLAARGYRQVRSHEDADLIFYNTCSIREKAVNKVFSRLGAFQQEDRKQQKILAVLGCVAQQEGEKLFRRAPQVRLICGSAGYRDLPELITRLEEGERRVTGLSLDVDECFETEITRRDNPYRAYLTIIEGCDKSCAYCVVPMTRGPERSRASHKILEECGRLTGEGFTEIQLLGQNVNSYRDPSPARRSFAELLGRVADVEGVRRVRFTTSHPRDFHPEIVAAIDSHPALCGHVHLPAQSGSTRVLRAMRRDYSREEYLDKIYCIRRAKRAISITTDLIVGFPGETVKDFEETLTLLDEVGYDSAFSFKYSPRPQTSALGLGDPVAEEEKGRRLAILLDRQQSIQLKRNQAFLGHEFEVLVETWQKRTGQLSGRTGSNRVVNFVGSPELRGRYVTVRLTRANPNSFVGEMIQASRAESRGASAWKSK